MPEPTLVMATASSSLPGWTPPPPMAPASPSSPAASPFDRERSPVTDGLARVGIITAAAVCVVAAGAYLRRRR